MRGPSVSLDAAIQWDSPTGACLLTKEPNMIPRCSQGPVNCHNGKREDKRRHKADDAADGGDTNIETPADRRLNTLTDCSQCAVCTLVA